MRTLFLYLILPCSVPLVQYNANSAEQVFKPVCVEFFRLFSKPFSCRSLNFIKCEMNFFEIQYFFGAANNQK
jgi:hypothetical protein